MEETPITEVENTIIFRVLIFIFLIWSIYAISLYIGKVVNPELAQLFLKYAEVFIWPLTIIGLLVLFRGGLNTFLSNSQISSVGTNGIGTRTVEHEQTEPSSKVDTKSIENFDEVAKEESATESTLTNETENTIWKLNLELDFERIYNYIFRGQIVLMNKLITGGPMSWQQIEGYFFLEAKKDPVGFKGWDTAKYLTYLANNELINIEGTQGNIMITQKGRVFIAYINSMNYQKLGI